VAFLIEELRLGTVHYSLETWIVFHKT